MYNRDCTATADSGPRIYLFAGTLFILTPRESNIKKDASKYSLTSYNREFRNNFSCKYIQYNSRRD